MKRSLLLVTAAWFIAGLATAHAEPIQLCRHFIDLKEKFGEGSSLRLEYDVSAEKAFNGFWMKLGPADRGNLFDVTGYKKLTLRVKGSRTAGIPAKFKVEVKGDAGDVIGHYYAGNIGPEWIKVEIPLDIYAGQGVQLAGLNELTIVFEHKAALPGAVKGAVWIDDITLEGDGPPKILADFNSDSGNNLGGAWGTFTP
jgi:hypothetical protein